MNPTKSNENNPHDHLLVLARTNEVPHPVPSPGDDLKHYADVLAAAAKSIEADTILLVVRAASRAWVEKAVEDLAKRFPKDTVPVTLIPESDLFDFLNACGKKNAFYVLPDGDLIPQALKGTNKYFLAPPRALYLAGPIKFDPPCPWPAGTSINTLRRETPAWTRSFTEIPKLREQLALVRTILKQQTVPEVPHTLLITGDTGTGKSHLAKCLPYILNPVFDNETKEFTYPKDEKDLKPYGTYRFGNCASLSEQLADSLLFGAKKGAYSGCEADRTGLLESAGDGILFLDEVGELPLGTQSKLLTVLEERKFYRLGDTGENAKCIDLKCFIIFGTNVNLQEAVAQCEQTHGEKGFRRDLFNRINAFTLHLPSLFERLHDGATSTTLSDLGNVFLSDLLARACETFSLTLTARAEDLFRTFATTAPWKGNFRDVRHIFQRLRVKLIAQGMGSTVSAFLMKEVLDDWKAFNATPSLAYPLMPEGLPLNVQVDLRRIFDACKNAPSCAEAGRRYYGPDKPGNISDLFKKHLACLGYRFDSNVPEHIARLPPREPENML